MGVGPNGGKHAARSTYNPRKAAQLAANKTEPADTKKVHYELTDGDLYIDGKLVKPEPVKQPESTTDPEAPVFPETPVVPAPAAPEAPAPGNDNK